jgi:hypothetical protein
VAGCYEHDNEPSSSIKGGEFIIIIIIIIIIILSL